MDTIAGIWTALSFGVFMGICWWAWSAGRQAANRESALLPFALPDEPILAPSRPSTGAHTDHKRNTVP